MGERVVVHCAIMVGQAYAIKENGELVLKKETTESISSFIGSKEFITEMNKLFGKGCWEMRVHEDPATPQFMDICKKMEEIQKASSETKHPEGETTMPEGETNGAANETTPAATEPEGKLKSEWDAKDGEYCMCEVPAESTETEDKIKSLVLNLESVKKEKSAAMKDYNEQIEDIEDKLVGLARGGSKTHVKAQVKYDIEHHKKDYIVDGKIVKSEVLKDSDLQLEMPLETPAKDEAPVLELLATDADGNDRRVDVWENEEWIGVAFTSLKDADIFTMDAEELPSFADPKKYIAVGTSYRNAEGKTAIKCKAFAVPDALPTANEIKQEDQAEIEHDAQEQPADAEAVEA